MSPIFIKFLKGFTIYTLLIVLISIAIRYALPEVKITPVYLYLIAFMYAINFLLFAKLSQAIQKKPSRFINAFMLLNFGKLFLYIILVAIYIFLYRNDAISFTITFVIYYILFTIYEVTALLKIKL
jgi:hypothetical protein